VKEIIGLSVGEVVLPVLVGVIFHGTAPYTLMLSLFIMAVVILGLYVLVEHVIHNKPSVEGGIWENGAASELLLGGEKRESQLSKDRNPSSDHSYYR
jgi:hypothetical protein